MKRDNLIGEHFGRLTVLKFYGTNSCGHSLWECKCSCGNLVTVAGTNLKRGLTTSCGCKRNEITIDRLKTHGMYGTPLYHSWAGMIRRCSNPNDKLYHRYGGRGIAVCDEWKSFEGFYQWSAENGYQSDLTIDRINNDEGYSPNNCRWTDRITQSNNTSQNRKITYNGITKTIADWARLLNLNYDYLYRHLSKGNLEDLENYFTNNRKENK